MNTDKAYLTEFEVTECQDGSMRYDMAFEIGAGKIRTESWATDDQIFVTFNNLPASNPRREVTSILESETYSIIGQCESFGWLAPAIEHCVRISNASLYELGCETREAANRWGLDDAADEREQFSDRDLSRNVVYEVLENCTEVDL